MTYMIGFQAAEISDSSGLVLPEGSTGRQRILAGETSPHTETVEVGATALHVHLSKAFWPFVVVAGMSSGPHTHGAARV